MDSVFSLQKTRDSLKEAFESLFEKYGRDFDDDDEIDILSLEVVKKSSKKDSLAQKPRKFGFLYKKQGEIIEEEEGEEENDISNDEDELNDVEDSKLYGDDQNDPTDLDRLFKDISSALVSVGPNKNVVDASVKNYLIEKEKKQRKANRKTTQLAFDFAILRLLEREKSKNIRNTIQLHCIDHPDGIERNCFDCSLINIIP